MFRSAVAMTQSPAPDGNPFFNDLPTSAITSPAPLPAKHTSRISRTFRGYRAAAKISSINSSALTTV